jgi:hypothetical protein
VPTRDQIVVPLQDGVRLDEQPHVGRHPPGHSTQQRRQQGAIARGEPYPLRPKLPLQHAKLVPKREDLRVLVRSLIGNSRSIANAFVMPR